MKTQKASKKAKKSVSRKTRPTVVLYREGVFNLLWSQLQAAQGLLEGRIEHAINEDSLGADAMCGALDFVEQAQTTARMLCLD